MANNDYPPRDTWSKLEIIAKLVGDVVLVALTIAIAYGTNKISTALQTGELTQHLLSDLASADSNSALRHEIALAALNYTVWDQNPQLVWEVCERIVSNSDYKVVDRTYAFNILRERDSTQALNILRSLTPVTGAIVSERESAVADSLLSTVPVKDEAYKFIVEQKLGNLIFIQFQGNVDRNFLKKLQSALNAAGYIAPGVERVLGQYSSEIRYFHKSDAAFAIEVGKFIEQFFLEDGKELRLVNRDLSTSGYHVPERQIEVWLNIR